MDYRIFTCESALYKKALKNLDSSISFFKETKKGVQKLTFNDVIHSYSIDGENQLSLRLYTGKESSLRIDAVIKSLAGVDSEDLFKFRITRTGQYRLINENMVKID